MVLRVYRWHQVTGGRGDNAVCRRDSLFAAFDDMTPELPLVCFPRDVHTAFTTETCQHILPFATTALTDAATTFLQATCSWAVTRQDDTGLEHTNRFFSHARCTFPCNLPGTLILSLVPFAFATCVHPSSPFASDFSDMTTHIHGRLTMLPYGAFHISMEGWCVDGMLTCCRERVTYAAAVCSARLVGRLLSFCG